MFRVSSSTCSILRQARASRKASCWRFRQLSTAAAATAEEGPMPLFLWLKSKEGSDDSSSSIVRPKLLLPPLATAAQATAVPATVSSIQDIVDAVNEHYCGESSEQFVGGMGESDPGVWFVTQQQQQQDGGDDDPLDHAELVAESIQAVKEQRHGVPFGLVTSGITDQDDGEVLSLLQGLNILQVSLYAASPPDYSAATGIGMPDAQQAFGRTCGFLALAGEQQGNHTLEASISKDLPSSSQTAGRDLALSLGAQQVHFY